MVSSSATSARPSAWADKQGPSPTVNCNRSASAARLSLAPSGRRRSDTKNRLMPAPSTGSTAGLAFASRSGRSSGPGRSAAEAATAALNRSWMVMRSPGVLNAEATHKRDDRQAFAAPVLGLPRELGFMPSRYVDPPMGPLGALPDSSRLCGVSERPTVGQPDAQEAQPTQA